MTLVNRKLQNITRVVCAEERYVIVTVGNILLMNLYLPCAGSVNRQYIYDEVFCNLLSWIDNYPDHMLILGGDLNVDIDNVCPISTLVNKFVFDCNLHRCDTLFNVGSTLSTYYNEALGTESNIDYFLVSDVSSVLSFSVLDPEANLSDHRPIVISCSIKNLIDDSLDVNYKNHKKPNPQLRWDYANLDLYRTVTGYHLQHIYREMLMLDEVSVLSTEYIDHFYDKVIDSLRIGSDSAVPVCRKNFLNHWWDSSMDDIKKQSMASCKLWKSAGRPRSGHIYHIYRKDKAAYKSSIRKKQREAKETYTNDLHEALLSKQGKVFWKCWSSKFESDKCKVVHVNGITDERSIAEQFAQYFAKVCTSNSKEGAGRLAAKYTQMRSEYCGDPIDDGRYFDAELVETVFSKLNRGKAAGLDGISTEHVIFCHPLLPAVLAKLFNFMIHTGHVPPSFGMSYTVPVPKNNANGYSKALTVDDFRGISISPILSKIFEHCILDRYCEYFVTSDNQFGFKRKSSCAHAIYTLRSVVDYYVHHGSTVNVCSLDLSKAFDKMDHHGLLIKLMERHMPVNILSLLEQWFAVSLTCVKWYNNFSTFFNLSCGVRQGGVLSPYLFACFIDSVVDKVKLSGVGCYLNMACMSIFLYADDILLVAPSVSSLQRILSLCEAELELLDMRVNAKKSSCIRFGPRFNVRCNSTTMIDKCKLSWSDSVRYLGIYLRSSRTFACSFSHAKQSMYRAFNAVFGKVGRIASPDVVVELVKTKCLPVLCYGIEVCPVNKSHIGSLQYVVDNCLRKIFDIKLTKSVRECMREFNWFTMCDLIDIRKRKFLANYILSENICQVVANVCSLL